MSTFASDPSWLVVEPKPVWKIWVSWDDDSRHSQYIPNIWKMFPISWELLIDYINNFPKYGKIRNVPIIIPIIFQNIWKNKIHVPNHQPASDPSMTTSMGCPLLLQPLASEAGALAGRAEQQPMAAAGTETSVLTGDQMIFPISGKIRWIWDALN